MNAIEYNREKSRQSRLEKLGCNEPDCTICGENDPDVLEVHHIGGRKYSRYTVIICRNHHRKVERLRMDHPSDLAGPPGHLECKGRVLLGISDLLAQLPQVPSELIEFVREVGQ